MAVESLVRRLEEEGAKIPLCLSFSPPKVINGLRLERHDQWLSIRQVVGRLLWPLIIFLSRIQLHSIENNEKQQTHIKRSQEEQNELSILMLQLQFLQDLCKIEGRRRNQGIIKTFVSMLFFSSYFLERRDVEYPFWELNELQSLFIRFRQDIHAWTSFPQNTVHGRVKKGISISCLLDSNFRLDLTPVSSVTRKDQTRNRLYRECVSIVWIFN